MTDWEIHDMAVQMVRERLELQGYELMSWQSNPEVDPSIWFVGDSKRPEWVVVRSAKFPANKAARPNHWDDIVANCENMSKFGHFASVAFVSEEQPFEAENEDAAPLLRGYGVHVNFEGLE